MKAKTYYYVDPLNDDFAGTKISQKPLPKHFRYVKRNPLWVLVSWIVYYLIAIPVMGAIGFFGFGVKVVGRKNLKKARFKGLFIYGNHTQWADSFFASVFISNPRRTYIVANPDAVSIFGVRNLVMMLGCLPLPSTVEETNNFIDSIDFRIRRLDAVVIYPEAHIWPYYTHIRPFPENSFTYPSKLGAPVFGLCTTYRHRRFLKCFKPHVILHVSEPFYPDMSLPLGERSKKLRDEVYSFMVDISSSSENVETAHYVRLTPEQMALHRSEESRDKKHPR